MKRDLKVLGSAWVWGRRRCLVEGELPPVPLAFVPGRETYTPTRAEALRIFEELHPDRWPRVYTPALAATGMRPNEAAVLTWGDVDLEHSLLHVGATSEGAPKTGRRAVPIDPLLGAELELWRGDRDPGPGEGLYGVLLRSITNNHGTRQLARACEAAGLPRHSAPAYPTFRRLWWGFQASMGRVPQGLQADRLVAVQRRAWWPYAVTVGAPAPAIGQAGQACGSLWPSDSGSCTGPTGFDAQLHLRRAPGESPGTAYAPARPDESGSCGAVFFIRARIDARASRRWVDRAASYREHGIT